MKLLLLQGSRGEGGRLKGKNFWEVYFEVWEERGQGGKQLAHLLPPRSCVRSGSWIIPVGAQWTPGHMLITASI